MKRAKRRYEKEMMKDKRGITVTDLPNLILILVLAAVFLGVGLLVLDKFHDTLTVGSEAEISVNATIAGVGDFSDWWATIVVVIAAAVIIGLVVTAFIVRGKRT